MRFSSTLVSWSNEKKEELHVASLVNSHTRSTIMKKKCMRVDKRELKWFALISSACHSLHHIHQKEEGLADVTPMQSA